MNTDCDGCKGNLANANHDTLCEEHVELLEAQKRLLARQPTVIGPGRSPEWFEAQRGRNR